MPAAAGEMEGSKDRKSIAQKINTRGWVWTMTPTIVRSQSRPRRQRTEGDMKAYVWLVLVISLLTMHVPTGVAQQTVHIRLAEAYFARIDIGIGDAERSNGADTLQGTLTRQPDGTWKGEVEARVSFVQAMGEFGRGAPSTNSRVLSACACPASP